MKSFLLMTAALAFVATPSFAASSPLMLENATAFETSEGMKNGAALVTIMNHGTETDKLVSASTPVTDHAEIHEMSETNGVMKMRQVDGVKIDGGQTVTFSPDGYHIMLMGLKAPLKAGTDFPLTLQFEKAGKMETTVHVKSRSEKPSETPSHEHMSH